MEAVTQEQKTHLLAMHRSLHPEDEKRRSRKPVLVAAPGKGYELQAGDAHRLRIFADPECKRCVEGVQAWRGGGSEALVCRCVLHRMSLTVMELEKAERELRAEIAKEKAKPSEPHIVGPGIGTVWKDRKRKDRYVRVERLIEEDGVHKAVCQGGEMVNGRFFFQPHLKRETKIRMDRFRSASGGFTQVEEKAE